MCFKSDCPYLHKKVNERTEICVDFLRGFCEKAEQVRFVRFIKVHFGFIAHFACFAVFVCFNFLPFFSVQSVMSSYAQNNKVKEAVN